MATETEKFFSAAADHLIALDEPTFVWLHTQCLADNWDAPYAMRAWYAAEDDPPPPTSQVAPHFDVGPNTDPDELLGWIQAYAASSLVEAFPWLIEPLLALALVYVVAAIWLLRRLAGR